MAEAYPAAPGWQSNPRPVGVTVLAVLSFIGAAGLALGGLALLLAGSVLAGVGATFAPAWAVAAGGAILMVIGIVFLAMAAVAILSGIGLLGGKPWAWTLTLVLVALNALSGILDLVSGNFGALLGIALAVLVIWYLFTPPVKAFFAKSHVKTPWESRSGAA